MSRGGRHPPIPVRWCAADGLGVWGDEHRERARLCCGLYVRALALAWDRGCASALAVDRACECVVTGPGAQRTPPPHTHTNLPPHTNLPEWRHPCEQRGQRVTRSSQASQACHTRPCAQDWARPVPQAGRPVRSARNRRRPAPAHPGPARGQTRTNTQPGCRGCGRRCAAYTKSLPKRPKEAGSGAIVDIPPMLATCMMGVATPQMSSTPQASIFPAAA